MGLVSLGVVYNAFAIPARGTFQFQLKRSVVTWLLFDYLFDMIYLLDIFLIQLRLSYRVQGVLEVSDHKLRLNFQQLLKLRLSIPSDGPQVASIQVHEQPEILGRFVDNYNPRK